MTADQLIADIRAAQQGDADAWERLLVTYRPAMESWSLSFSPHGEMSQRDLVQVAWLQVFKGLDKFNGVEQPEHVAPMFYKWLRITARNAMLTLLKHRSTQRRAPEHPMVNGDNLALTDPEQRTPSSIVARGEQINRLQVAVQNLADPLDRQIVAMVTKDGLSLRVVAGILGRDYSTIRRRFHNVLAKLGNVMGPP